jgi:ketosteroid isomerase-like protein
MTPRAVPEKWIDLLNAVDVEGFAMLHTQDAVNHQVADEPVAGRNTIRDMFAREFAAANMVCIPEAIHEAGDVVAPEGKDPPGLRGLRFL